MLRSKVIAFLYFMLFVFSIFTFLLVQQTFKLNVEDEFHITYLPNCTGVSIYSLKEYNNEMSCNLTTVNTIIKNMISEGYYEIIEDKSEDNLLDITLSGSEGIFRILYNRSTRDYLCVSSPLQNNYIPMTYIHGGKE